MVAALVKLFARLATSSTEANGVLLLPHTLLLFAAPKNSQLLSCTIPPTGLNFQGSMRPTTHHPANWQQLSVQHETHRVCRPSNIDVPPDSTMLLYSSRRTSMSHLLMVSCTRWWAPLDSRPTRLGSNSTSGALRATNAKVQLLAHLGVGARCIAKVLVVRCPHTYKVRVQAPSLPDYSFAPESTGTQARDSLHTSLRAHRQRHTCIQTWTHTYRHGLQINAHNCA